MTVGVCDAACGQLQKMKESGDCLGWSVEMPGGFLVLQGRWRWEWLLGLVCVLARESRDVEVLSGFVFSKGKGRLAAVFGQEREMLDPGFVVVSWGRNGCGNKNPQSSHSGQGALVLSFSKETLQRRLNREREAFV
jgi:hypothetical protein